MSQRRYANRETYASESTSNSTTERKPCTVIECRNHSKPTDQTSSSATATDVDLVDVLQIARASHHTHRPRTLFNSPQMKKRKQLN